MTMNTGHANLRPGAFPLSLCTQTPEGPVALLRPGALSPSRRHNHKKRCSNTLPASDGQDCDIIRKVLAKSRQRLARFHIGKVHGYLYRTLRVMRIIALHPTATVQRDVLAK